MSYLKKTFDYLLLYGKGKRFFLFLLLFLPPCVIVGFFFPLSKYFDILFTFRTAEYASFGSLWLNSFNSSGWALLALAVSVVAFVLVAAYFSGIITRHIRLGKLSFPNLWRTVNNNFFPALTLTLFFLGVMFAAHFLFVLVTYIWLQLASRVLGLVMTVLFFLLIIVGMVYLLSAVTPWLPTMTFTGTYVFRALGIAFGKSRAYQRKFFFDCLFISVVALLAAFGCHYITVWYVNGIVHSVIYSTIVTVLMTYAFISYCEIESVKREDLSRRYFGR